MHTSPPKCVLPWAHQRPANHVGMEASLAPADHVPPPQDSLPAQSQWNSAPGPTNLIPMEAPRSCWWVNNTDKQPRGHIAPSPHPYTPRTKAQPSLIPDLQTHASAGTGFSTKLWTAHPASRQPCMWPGAVGSWSS